MPRRILLVSLYHPELLRGGSQQICYEMFRALQKTDWEPILLASTQEDLTPALFKPGAVITGFDGRKNEFLFLSGGYDHAWHRNRDPIRLEAFETFLRDVAPDVIHFHHFMTYGMEYIAAARKYLNGTGGKLIFTLHEFLAICMADGHMARTFNKAPCEQASSVRCHQCFPSRTPEFFSLRRMWIKHHFDMVDMFVATSMFARQKYIEWGIPAERLVHIPAGHRDLAQPRATSSVAVSGGKKRNRFAFFGQLIDSKGLLVLFDAVKIVRSAGFEDFALDIHGSNLTFGSADFQEKFASFWEEERERSNAGAQRLRLRGMYEVSDLAQIMTDVDWVVVPSNWGETFVMVISESFAFGKPVICSNIGVMAERVRDSVTGLHFAVGDSDSLAAVMIRAMTEENLWVRLSANIEPPPTAEMSVQQHMELCYAPRDLSPDWTQEHAGSTAVS